MRPLQRSLGWLRKQGYLAQKVEHWNAFAKRRVDLFGFADIVAVRAGEPGVTAIQVCWKDVPAHVEKLNAIPAVSTWLSCGNRLVIHSWAKKGPRGKRKVWTLAQIGLPGEGVPKTPSLEASQVADSSTATLAV